MKNPPLYKIVKEALPPHQVVISDQELLVLNRKEYHLTQISPVHAFLNSINMEMSYSDRLLLSLLDQLSNIPRTRPFEVICCQPGLTIAGFYAWILYSGDENFKGMRFPFGILEVKGIKGLMADLYNEFKAIPTRTLGLFRQEFDRIILCEASNTSDMTYAYDRLAEAKSGLALIKDYGKVGSLDEREYGEAKNCFPHVTLEGHAFIAK